MKKLTCSVCGFECSVPDEHVLDYCPICQSTFGNETSAENWVVQLSQDECHWYSEGFRRFPSIIAHEYWRLRELLEQRKVFAACFQLRDVMESVLKYEVLAICAWANEKDIPGFQEQVGCQITTRSMSFGSWKALAELIRDFFAPAKETGSLLPEVFSDALRGIISQYGPFVHWRNENIGHGALGFEEDESFQKEFTEMVDKLRDLFRYRAKQSSWSVGEALCLQPLYLNGQVLIGYDKAEQLSGDRNDLRIVNTSEGFDFAVSPYILLSEGTIFFFDNQKEKNKTERQSYVTGKRKSKDEPFFTRLMQMNTSADRELDIASSMRIQAEDELLNRLDLEPRFIKPEYLLKWLRGNLKKYEKGVFLLKMPRGTGKSTFTEKLNCLYEGPERLDNDLDVRTYHISRSQMIRQNDFAQHIEEQWAHAFDAKREWMRYKHIQDYLSEGSEPAEALCSFLKECLKFTQSRRYKQRIMLVIDGLDEIEEPMLWSFIPAPEQLPEDVYILLTSRDPETEALPEHTKQRLSELRYTEELRTDMQGQGNQRFLEAYLEKYFSKGKKGRKPSKEEFETMKRLAECRVLNLGMLCKLVDAGVPVSALPDARNQLEQYLKILYESYGEKESLRLRELLSVLCSIGAEEPISVHEIAGLLNTRIVSLGLLGMLNDLEPLLHVQRGYMANGRVYPGENRYTPTNIAITTAIRDLIPEWNAYIHERLVDTNSRICDITNNNRNECDDDKSEMFITTPVISYEDELNLLLLSYEDEETLSQLYIEKTVVHKLQFIQNATNYLCSYYEEAKQLLQLSRIAIAYENLIRWIESFVKDNLVQAWNIYVTLYLKAAITLNALGRHLEALTYCNCALDYAEKTVSQACNGQIQISLLVDLFLEIAICQWGDDSACFSQYSKEVAIIKKCEKYLSAIERAELVDLYYLWTMVLSGLEKYEEALLRYEDFCSICEEMQFKGQAIEVYFKASKEAVDCLIKLDRFEEALIICEKELNRLECFDSKDSPIEKDQFVPSCCLLAAQFQALGKNEIAEMLCNKAFHFVEITTIDNQEYFASNLLDLAETMHTLGHDSDALTVYKKAEGIFEKLDSQGTLSDPEKLFLTYTEIAKQLRILMRNKDALIFYRKAALFCEKMDTAGLLFDRRSLFNAYYNIADQLAVLHKNDEALVMLERAKVILQELDTDYPLNQLNMKIIERTLELWK